MSIYDDVRPLGLEGVNTYPLEERPSKVSVADFAQPVEADATLRAFLKGLPNILAVQSLRQIAASFRQLVVRVRSQYLIERADRIGQLFLLQRAHAHVEPGVVNHALDGDVLRILLEKLFEIRDRFAVLLFGE